MWLWRQFAQTCLSRVGSVFMVAGNYHEAGIEPAAFSRPGSLPTRVWRFGSIASLTVLWAALASVLPGLPVSLRARSGWLPCPTLPVSLRARVCISLRQPFSSFPVCRLFSRWFLLDAKKPGAVGLPGFQSNLSRSGLSEDSNGQLWADTRRTVEHIELPGFLLVFLDLLQSQNDTSHVVDDLDHVLAILHRDRDKRESVRVEREVDTVTCEDRHGGVVGNRSNECWVERESATGNVCNCGVDHILLIMSRKCDDVANHKGSGSGVASKRGVAH